MQSVRSANAAACLSLLLLAGGCNSFRNGFGDATNTLDPRGPDSLSPTNYKTQDEPLHPGQVGLFEVSYSKAWEDQRIISQGGIAPTNAPAHARQMAKDGMFLVDGYCQDFFRHGGDNQKWLDVAKDLTAALGSIATGALAIASPSNATAAAVVALSTATAYNGVDLYTKNFLFGSDNIESVRTLTMNALAADRTASGVDGLDDTGWTFGKAAQAIMQHQDLCTPASIRASVVAAISTTKVTASASSASSPNPINAATQAAQSASPNTSTTIIGSVGAAAGSAASAAAALPGATPSTINKAASAAANAVPGAPAAAATAAAKAAAAATQISSSSVVQPGQRSNLKFNGQ